MFVLNILFKIIFLTFFFNNIICTNVYCDSTLQPKSSFIEKTDLCLLDNTCLYDPLLVIVLMVKNESLVIRQTLQPYIEAGLDSFLIFDTGSTDDTVLVTKNFFEKNNIKHAVIKQEQFVDFSISRNRALQLAQESFPNACFMLMPDAEWYMQNVNVLLNFCNLNKNEMNASYLVHIMNKQIDYYVPRLIRCKTNILFVGSIHETLNRCTSNRVPGECYLNGKHLILEKKNHP